MTTPDNESADKLVNLAVELDEQLKRKSSESGVIPQPKLKRDRVEQLTDDEVGELNEASEALAFLEQVRMDLGVLESGDGTPRKPPADAVDVLSGGQSFLDSPNLGSSEDIGLDNQKFGRFEIVEAIGQGGFARVFRAYDPSLEREVALKIPRPQVLASKESQARFVREGKAAALLSHPSIVTVFEAGALGPINYIASEYCPGETLADWFVNQNQKTSINIAAKVIAKLADAVHHAHQRGVIHRDLKPANILVEQGDGELENRVRVTDFGLAKQMATEDVTLTIEGAVVGTPAYMSPEQIRCDPEIGVGTDIYSLGVILYELLTGIQPHKKSGISATIRAVESEPVKSARKLRTDVPAELDAICQKCMAKDPAERYLTSFELSADLERFLNGQPVHAKRPSPLGRLVKWTKRNPIIATCLAVTFLSLVGGMATSWSMYQKSEVDRLAAVDSKNDAIELRKSETAALGLAKSRLTEMHNQMDLLTNIFEELKNSNQGGFDEELLSLQLRDNLVEASNRIFESKTDPSLRSNMASRLGFSLGSLGYGAESLEITSKALELAKDSELDESELLVLQLFAAYGKHFEQQFADVIQDLGTIIDPILESGKINTEKKIFALHILANAFANTRQPAEAAKFYRRLVAKIEETKSLQSEISIADQRYLDSRGAKRLLTSSVFRIAASEYLSTPSKEGLDDLIKVQQNGSKTLGADDFASIGSAVEVAMILSGAQRFDEALPLAEQAYQNSLETFGKAHSQTISAINALVITCAMNQGDPKFNTRLQEMLPIGRDACMAFSEKYGDDHPQVIGIYGNIASAFGVAGDLDSCIKIKRDLVVIAERKYTREHILTQNQIMGLGVALAQNDELNESRKLLEEYLDFAETSELAEKHSIDSAKNVLELISAEEAKSKDSDKVDD